MAAVPEGPFPYRIAKESSTSSNPTDAVIFVGVCLVLGIASRHLLRGTKVPYTFALLILGIGIGSLEYGTNNGLGKIGDGIRLWANIDPDLLLAVFLPALLFESSFSMEVHQIKKCMVQMLLLAGPGVMISTFCLGSLLKLTFPYNWSWKTSLLLGGLLSATDPVAVVALLKELGASKKLSTIIEGESLMNDGTAIVVYQLFYKMVLGQSFNWIAIVKFLSQVSLGAVGIGLAFGIASVLWLGFIFNDTVIEITLTLAVSYIAYFAAQEGADVSGVLTVMTLGMYYAAVARTAFKGDGQQSLHHFWEMVAYIANTLIFILSGVVIAEGVLGNHNLFGNNGKAWGYLILLYVFVQVSRIVVVGVLYPALCFFGYGLDLKEATILTWAGLRGAVALSLSLSVKNASGSSYLSSETGTLFVFFTGGIVFLTLIVNGSTTQFILHLLGMDKLSAAKRRILDYTRYEMLNKALEAFGDLGDDEELGPADWPTVKKYIASLNNVEGGPVHPHSGTESDNLDDMNLEDIRIRLLNGVQAAYWGMLDEGRITKTTANLLMQSVDEALDLVQHEPLCDWKGLKDEVHFPNYYKFLQTSICPQKLVTYFIVERLESACYICAAFLRAHRIARTQLHEFIGESEIASKVASESEAEGEEARKFLEDVRVTFPQVLRVVKTRQVTYSVLNHLINYVQNLEKVGLLEQKEMLHLHDAVQTDLKKFLRNPPLAKISKIRDLSSTHPLLDALPSPISDSLKGSSKEVMKMRGVTLFREGVKPNGVWLIFNGVVKWTSKSIRNKHSLHPTFMHGSTLGLYEVLTGKPYLCNMITESVAMCFFLETDNILSLLQSDPAIEDFLWQESAIILVRLLLPKIFEKMAMQELRALAVERSRMNIYIRGETIEIPQRSIGFLLEGFIKPQGVQEEIITPPAALLPPHVDHSFCSFEISGEKPTSFSHQGSWYEVETRARVIVFDMASVEAESGLQRWSSSRSQLGDRPPRLLSKEHGGLMSWPENFFIQKHHHQNHPERTDQHANSFSARAMQLSIFGSMVNMRRRATSFSKGSSQVNPSHSLSYPSAPSNHGRPLVSVRSEGSTTMRRNLDMRECAVLIPKPPLESTITNDNLIRDVSSDESDTEEHLVRIDSPSNLSFRRAS